MLHSVELEESVLHHTDGLHEVTIYVVGPRVFVLGREAVGVGWII
jgi:hypothetical protein